MRGKPIGSITQVGCFVSSHLTPPAVLSSPMNLKKKICIEILTAICLRIRFDHQSLPHVLGSSLILKPTQCFETALDFLYDYVILDMRPPCVWELFPQPPYQGLLNLLGRNWLIQNIQHGQNVQNVQTSWSVSVTKSLAALFSVT